MTPVPYNTKIGAKRTTAAYTNNKSTPNKRFKICNKSPTATPPIGQITFNFKVPPHGYQVQSASSEKILASAKKRLFEQPIDSQNALE